MPVRVVAYDPDGVLSPTFASDEGLGDEFMRVDDLADAHRCAGRAQVLVIVGGRDRAGAVGLLTSFGGAGEQVVVLFLTDARRQRRLVLNGGRRGAIMLIGQAPDALGACLRELAPPFTGGEPTAPTPATGVHEPTHPGATEGVRPGRRRARDGSQPARPRSRYAVTRRYHSASIPKKAGSTAAARARLPRSSVLVRSRAVVSCPRDDGTLLLDMNEGGRMVLDQFGSRVWTALAERPTLAALLTRLRGDDTSVQRLAEDVTRLLARWRAKGLISWR